MKKKLQQLMAQTKNDILVSIKNEIHYGQAIGVRQDTDSTDTSELPSEYKYIFDN
jgi:hypothetical protein